MTERDDLPQLPKGWVTTTLGEIAIVMDVDHKMPKAVEKGIVFLSPKDFVDQDGIDIADAKRISEEDYQRLCKKIKPGKGDILYTRIGTIGKVRRVPDKLKFQISYSLCVVRPPIQLQNSGFLFWLMQSPQIMRQALAKRRSIGVPDLGLGDIKKFEITIPPLPEQHRIVVKIEELFSDLDAGVESLRKIQAQLKRYRQAVLKAAVEGKLTAEWRAGKGDHKGRPNIEPASVLLERIRAERGGGAHGRAPQPNTPQRNAPMDASELPELPQGWIYCHLNEIAEVRLGRQRSPARATGPNMRQYLRAANVTWNGLDLSDVKEMDFSPTELETYRLKRGDILLSEASGSISEVGKPAIWNEQIKNCCLQNTLIRVRSFNPLPAYLHIHFYYDASTERFRKIAKGVGIHHLGAENISNWVVSIPPLAEQQQIVAEVERRLSVADAVEKTVNTSLKQAERLRQSILKRAFEGKLVPQEPSDEPAEKLLERIRAERVGMHGGASDGRTFVRAHGGASDGRTFVRAHGGASDGRTFVRAHGGASDGRTFVRAHGGASDGRTFVRAHGRAPQRTPRKQPPSRKKKSR